MLSLQRSRVLAILMKYVQCFVQRGYGFRRELELSEFYRFGTMKKRSDIYKRKLTLKMEPQIKLVNHTALAFTVEVNNQQIQNLRKDYDPAFQRWEPHINFCFPFVDQPSFPATFDTLQPILKQLAPFDISFKKMDFFPHGTVFLVPEVNGNQLRQIYSIITTAIPELKAKREFHPHMTVGKFGKGEVKARCDELQQDWKEWVVRCDGICMIERGKDTPFKTYRKIEFTGQ